ncbi:GIY-YIG nuclease family protein [Methylobacterium sp. SD274]|uniref:GIY-YIG nuclease family protein n=1 Tax=Methylobacterium sp. SD274 TaxID=2782009 RepID=UPI001A96B799|nr:GIY-YIG nuclease family protein [Methylobacterium sp. SD274]MBO1022841.1 GIY-YIG nuclease family protein [Methylobacterium sp. SD274]
MRQTVGRSLELYYIDGRPDGMVAAEVFNWTGHVLMFPRTQLNAALARPEAGYAGVYLLLGDQEGDPFAYVGESEDIGARIRQHDVQKEWWTSAVLVTASANKLNKAHVRYLEARLIAHAKAIGHTPLDNLTAPVLPTLSEADIAKMEAFLENLLIVLPAVRVDMLIQRARPVAQAALAHSNITSRQLGADHTRFVLEARRHGLRASAVLVDGEFVVEAGSMSKLEWRGLKHHSYAPLYAELRRSGVLMEQGGHCVFTQNYAFRSPSAAAAAVNGRASNGQIDWRTEDGVLTYRDWEARQLAAQAGVSA